MKKIQPQEAVTHSKLCWVMLGRGCVWGKGVRCSRNLARRHGGSGLLLRGEEGKGTPQERREVRGGLCLW